MTSSNNTVVVPAPIRLLPRRLRLLRPWSPTGPTGLPVPTHQDVQDPQATVLPPVRGLLSRVMDADAMHRPMAPSQQSPIRDSTFSIHYAMASRGGKRSYDDFSPYTAEASRNHPFKNHSRQLPDAHLEHGPGHGLQEGRRHRHDQVQARADDANSSRRVPMLERRART